MPEFAETPPGRYGPPSDTDKVLSEMNRQVERNSTGKPYDASKELRQGSYGMGYGAPIPRGRTRFFGEDGREEGKCQVCGDFFPLEELEKIGVLDRVCSRCISRAKRINRAEHFISLTGKRRSRPQRDWKALKSPGIVVLSWRNREDWLGQNCQEHNLAAPQFICKLGVR